MLRLGILAEGYIYPKEIRPIRDLLRKRVMLISHRTSHILSLENMILRNRAIKYNAKAIKRLNEETIKELFEEEHLIMAAQSDKSIIDALTEQSEAIEKAVIKQVKLKYPYVKLLTVDGIGEILGITIMLETGDISRFKTGSDYSSYSRCVSSRRESNGKKKGEGNKKNGNRYLSWAYVEAANFMRRYNEEARQWHQRKASKTNQIVATKALANKISKACYFIIRDESEFDSKRLFNN
jgi:transposase